MDLTKGNITGKLIKFALPLMLGNILQQCYNIADTLIVGRYVGNDALAAVGASYTLMIFLTSIILGLSMGSGAFISMEFGKKDYDRMKNGIVLAFGLIGSITLLITFVFFAEINNIIKFLQIPTEITKLTKQYLLIIGIGIIDAPIQFLTSRWTLLIVISVVVVWRSVPFMALVCLAGRQSIPSEIYEAAKIDGGTGKHIFRYITLPLMKPFLALGITSTSVTAINVFDEIVALSGYSDLGKNILMDSYLTTFTFLNFGKGSAMTYT